MRTLFYAISALLIAFSNTFAQSNKQSSDSIKIDKKQQNGQFAIRHLQEDLEDILSVSELSNASIGISVINLETGETFYKKNPNILLIPASTLKLFTTAAGLEVLGSDFHYATRIYIDGTIKDSGELDGDIIIRASGDPSMSLMYMKDPTVILDNIALKLDSLRIKSIKGNIILDHGYFDNESFGPGWAIDDVPYPYSAPISAISFYDNKVELSFKPGVKAGDYSRLTIIPDNSYLRIVNNVMTVQSNTTTVLETDSDPSSGVIDIQGEIALPDLTS
ncbi:MAG: D-alanyl-D-alanine carboxypeptidase/D-alanyl-D-alanine-endopeptidase, partial [Ignavibacteria bacterium]